MGGFIQSQSMIDLAGDEVRHPTTFQRAAPQPAGRMSYLDLQRHTLCRRTRSRQSQRDEGLLSSSKGTNVPSCYKLASMTRACAVVQSRKKSEKRGVTVSHPRALRPMVCMISGFFTTMKGRLFIPLRRDKYFDFQLNRHVLEVLEGKRVRSLTITPDSLSLCYSVDAKPQTVVRVDGVDRNEKSITFGDSERVT